MVSSHFFPLEEVDLYLEGEVMIQTRLHLCPAKITSTLMEFMG